MDSAQKTLISIAIVSKSVVNTLVGHANCKTVESFLDKIAVGSGAVLEMLNKALLKDGNVDGRLVDWLKGDEPQACLHTLSQMEEILNRKPRHGVQSFFKRSYSAHTQDNTNEAIRLFQMRKGYFHFLLTAEIWDRESGQQQSRLMKQPDLLYITNALPLANGQGLAPAAQSMGANPLGVVRAREMNTTKSKQGVNLEKLDDVLGWLNACHPRSTHERTIVLRQRDTCTWLPNTHTYKMWRNADISFLWLHGKAGAGKSVLAASVIEDVMITLRNGEVLAYFYCDFRNERSTSGVEVLRSLLSQLLHQFRRHMVDPGDLIDELIEERDEGASTISNVMVLARHVSRVAKQFPQRPSLVIDALDECKDVEVLLDALVELHKDGIRLFVISRPLQIIKDSFLSLPSIDMETMHYQVLADIKLHVTKELDSHRRLRIVDARLKDEIHSTLCKRAGGMFRWVQCQLNTLKQCSTMVRIRETLNDLPSGLDATYERILLKINETEEGKVARRALDWLVAAFCPMQLCQIMEGISIDLSRRVLDRDSAPLHGPALLDALGSLVVYDEVTDIVILSHFSVKEYLTRKSTRTRHPAYYINQQDVHMQLALLCMCYISIWLELPESQQSSGYGTLPHGIHWPTRRIHHNVSDVAAHCAIGRHRPSVLSSESHPLLEYVLSNGFEHLAHVNPRKTAVLHAIEALQSAAQSHPLGWGRLCERSDHLHQPWPTLKHDLVLYILIAFAPESLLRSFINGAKLRLKDGTNPLIYAAYFQKTEHARTLLSSGVNLNRRGWDIHDPYQRLPLEVALDGNRAMVDLFLTEGSPVPHYLFACAGHAFPAHNVSRLLQTDEYVEWVAAHPLDEGVLLRLLNPIQYHPAYDCPSEQDIDTIQRRLVQVGCDPSARFDSTSLIPAVSVGHVSTVKHILSLGIPLPHDILLYVSSTMHSKSAMIRLFLDVGCDVDVVSSTGDTPLHLAVRTSRASEDDDCLKGVQALIDAGCSPLASNKAGETPFHTAARNGITLMIEYFLSLPILPPPDILLEASESCTVSTIQLLVDKGANVHAITAHGNTPLHFLFDADDSREGHLECAEIFINAGCNPCLPNAYGETPFDVAVKKGHRHIVEYLLSMNILWSPSILLSVSGSTSFNATPMIKFLVSKGANIQVTRPDGLGDTLLHLAIKNLWEKECLKRVQILVDAGCDPHACNSAGETPFHIAAMRRFISVMEYLLSLGISVPANVMLTQFQVGWSPSSYPTICFLLNKGGDVHSITRNGDTLLHLMAQFDSEAVEHLVRLGCSPYALNSTQETPLHIAARSGRISVIEYFLSLNIALPPDILLATASGTSWKTVEMTRYLIDKGADVSVVTNEGDTALHLLLTQHEKVNIEEDRLGSVKILVDAGCEPRSRNLAGKTPMHAAAKIGFTTVLEYLLLQDVPLPHDILLTSSPRTIHFLLGKGVDVSCVAANVDMQLMHRALDHVGSEEDYLECANTLVGAGWDPSLMNSAGETPMHIAARHGQIPTMQYLLSQNVPLPSDVLLAQAVPRDGAHHIIPDIPLIRFLIREGANINTANSSGDTPLHLALRFKCILDERFEFGSAQWKVVEILLDSGSDPSARNVDGRTPFDIAEANGRFFNENFLRLVQKSHRIRS